MTNSVQISQGVAEIWRFLKMAAAAILDFYNFTFLTVGTVKSVELRQCVKFCRNRSNRCRDLAFFIFQNGGLRNRGL